MNFAFSLHNADICPIHVLPPELLFDIFAFCTENDGLAPLKLRQVCSRWKEVADTSPLLWTTLSLDNTILSPGEVDVWSTNAGSLKYDIELNLTSHEHLLPMLSPLLPYVDRWGYLSFRDRPDDGVMVEEYNLSPDKLTHLVITLYDYEDVWEVGMDDIQINISEMGSTSEYCLDITLAYLPKSYLRSHLPFTHLILIEGGQNGINPNPADILAFLASSPQLESFIYVGFPHDEPDPPHVPVVHLPNLRILHLKSTCFVRILLSNLDAPSLQTLILAHTNVSYQLLNAGESSEGASDDEANDFSQSPSSDKATGIGLRKLLQRSSPPLLTLSMDYSDMRTKDFQHVFDRLPYLEDFRIVASDMSDKVVNLLRPLSFSDTAAQTVRLPHLRKLGLMNCTRMTGDAIVETIRERVAWTDQNTPAWTLVDVDVTSCFGVDLVHRWQLQQFLGNRLSGVTGT